MGSLNIALRGIDVNCPAPPHELLREVYLMEGGIVAYIYRTYGGGDSAGINGYS